LSHCYSTKLGVDHTPYYNITVTPTLQQLLISCPSGNNCPHLADYNSNPNTPNVNVLAFVLACEAGNNYDDALNIAWIFRNRMRSALYRSTVWDIMRQPDQWDCFHVGSLPNAPVTSYAVINPQILVLAQNMITYNGNIFQVPTLDAHQIIRYYGLFTYGVGPFDTLLSEIPLSDLLDRLIANIQAQGQCPHDRAVLEDLIIEYSRLQGRAFTTVFFTDSPVRSLNPC
jgi:hypothetical protein